MKSTRAKSFVAAVVFVGLSATAAAAVDIGFLAFLLIVLPIAIALLWWLDTAEELKVKKLYRYANYYRETPLSGNLEAAHMLARQFYQSKDDSSLIAAAFMQLLVAGCLVPISNIEAGSTGRSNETVPLRLVKPPEFRGVTAKGLYELLTQAAGSDRLLNEKKLGDYCKGNHGAMSVVIQASAGNGNDTLVGIGCYRSGTRAGTLRNLTERGQGQLMNLMGFEKYLLEFASIGDREVSEAVIWRDYLTFATLLGITEPVIEQFGKLYPHSSVYHQQAQSLNRLVHRYSQCGMSGHHGHSKTR